MRPVIAIATLLAALPNPLVAQEFVALSDEQLAEQRGGFNIAGLEVNFGAEIRTYLEGELVLQTNINWRGNEGTRTEFVSDALSAPDAAQIEAGVLTGPHKSFSMAGQKVFLANGGQTALLHRTDGAIQNILLNTANNVTAHQQVDAVLDLSDTDGFLQGVADARVGDALLGAISQGLLALP